MNVSLSTSRHFDQHPRWWQITSIQPRSQTSSLTHENTGVCSIPMYLWTDSIDRAGETRQEHRREQPPKKVKWELNACNLGPKSNWEERNWVISEIEGTIWELSERIRSLRGLTDIFESRNALRSRWKYLRILAIFPILCQSLQMSVNPMLNRQNLCSHEEWARQSADLALFLCHFHRDCHRLTADINTHVNGIWKKRESCQDLKQLIFPFDCGSDGCFWEWEINL
jgi:hypothetical protein